MRQVDETNFEQDRVSKVEADLTKKLTAFIERINVKISSLEAKVGSLMAPQAPKNEVIGRYDPFDTPCSENTPVAHYSLYGIDALITINNKAMRVIEVTFDRQGILYTLSPVKGSVMDNVIICEDDLVEKIKQKHQ